MKLKTVYKFSIDSILKSFKSFFASFMLCIAAFLLIGISSYAFDLTQHGKKEIDNILQEGIKGTGIIRTENDLTEEGIKMVSQFCKKAYELDEIKAIGEFVYSEVDYPELSELREIQHQYGKTTSKEFITNAGLEVLVMNAELPDLVKLPLEKGERIEEIPPEEEDCSVLYVYLGSNFSNIPIGTTYEVRDDEGIARLKYCVKGILKKGAKWIGEDILFRTEILRADTTVPLDNIVVCVEDCTYGGSWTYNISKGASFEGVEKKLKGIAKECGIHITLGTAKATFREIEKANSKITTYAFQLFSMIMITTFIVMMCTQLAGILNQLSEYGILYANGASTWDLLYILLVENVIKIVSSLFLSGVMLILLLELTYNRVPIYMRNIAKEVLFQNTYIKLILIGVIFCICLSSIPMIILKRMKPTTLLGGNVE